MSNDPQASTAAGRLRVSVGSVDINPNLLPV